MFIFFAMATRPYQRGRMQSDSLEYIRPYLSYAAVYSCHFLITIASYYFLYVSINLANLKLTCVSYYNAGFWLIMMSCTIGPVPYHQPCRPYHHHSASCLKNIESHDSTMNQNKFEYTSHQPYGLIASNYKHSLDLLSN